MRQCSICSQYHDSSTLVPPNNQSLTYQKYIFLKKVSLVWCAKKPTRKINKIPISHFRPKRQKRYPKSPLRLSILSLLYRLLLNHCICVETRPLKKWKLTWRRLSREDFLLRPREWAAYWTTVRPVNVITATATMIHLRLVKESNRKRLLLLHNARTGRKGPPHYQL